MTPTEIAASLTPDEVHLVQWLFEGGDGLVGETKGRSFDRAVALGLIEIAPDARGMDWSRASLNPAGEAVREALVAAGRIVLPPPPPPPPPAPPPKPLDHGQWMLDELPAQVRFVLDGTVGIMEKVAMMRADYAHRQPVVLSEMSAQYGFALHFSVLHNEYGDIAAGSPLFERLRLVLPSLAPVSDGVLRVDETDYVKLKLLYGEAA